MRQLTCPFSDTGRRFRSINGQKNGLRDFPAGRFYHGTEIIKHRFPHDSIVRTNLDRTITATAVLMQSCP